MCRFRSGEPSSHHAGPRSPSARLTSSTALCAAPSASRSAAFLRRVPPAGPPSAGRRVQFAQPHRDRGSPCATACRGRRSSDRPASPDASRYARPTSAAVWPPASLPQPPSPASCRRSASAFPSDRWRPCVASWPAWILCRLCGADALAQRVHQIHHVLAAGPLFRSDRFAGALWLMRSMRAVSYWSSNLSGSKRPAF